MHTAGESERVVREPLGVHLARVLQLDDTLYQITVCVCVCVYGDLSHSTEHGEF